jgi:hypothetical protein
LRDAAQRKPGFVSERQVAVVYVQQRGKIVSVRVKSQFCADDGCQLGKWNLARATQHEIDVVQLVYVRNQDCPAAPCFERR